MPHAFVARGLISEIYNITALTVCKPPFSNFFDFFEKSLPHASAKNPRNFFDFSENRG